MNLSQGRQSYAQVLFSRERVPSFHHLLQKVTLTVGLMQSPILQMGKPRPRAGMPYAMSPSKLVVAHGPLLLPRGPLCCQRPHTPEITEAGRQLRRCPGARRRGWQDREHCCSVTALCSQVLKRKLTFKTDT